MSWQDATTELRRSRLDLAVEAELATGARIAAQGRFSCALVRSRGVQHWKHALMSVITVGAWIPVWVIAALLPRREQVLLVEVDEDGEVTQRPRPAVA